MARQGRSYLAGKVGAMRHSLHFSDFCPLHFAVCVCSYRHGRRHSLPPGAFPTDAGVRYRVWAPEETLGRRRCQRRRAHGRPASGRRRLFSKGIDADGRAGDLYKFRLDGDEGQVFPDPLSRYQPEGVHGPSMVIRPGTATSGGTNRRHARPRSTRSSSTNSTSAPSRRQGTFPRRHRASSTTSRNSASTPLELMPLADFPGRWNWGYDGVFLYAPSRAYGHPDDLRALVDAAHARGMFVVLDAVYNHLGPDGNYLGAYTKNYFNPAHIRRRGATRSTSMVRTTSPVRQFFRRQHRLLDGRISLRRLPARRDPRPRG